jgi:hypothetical protein
MHPVIQAPLYLVIDLGAKPGQTAEGRLDMTAGAAKPVVQVEVAESGVEVVAPHQANDATPQPDTFGIAGRTIDRLGRFGEFVGPALVVAGGVGRTGSRLGGLFGVCGRPALGEGGAETQRQGQSGNNEIAQNRNPPVKHPLTHKFPEYLVPTTPYATHDAQLGPECGGSVVQNPMAEILHFVQQTTLAW